MGPKSFGESQISGPARGKKKVYQPLSTTVSAVKCLLNYLKNKILGLTNKTI